MIVTYHNDNINGHHNRKDGGTVVNKYTIESIYRIICPAKYTIDNKDKTKDQTGTNIQNISLYCPQTILMRCCKRKKCSRAAKLMMAV